MYVSCLTGQLELEDYTIFAKPARNIGEVIAQSLTAMQFVLIGRLFVHNNLALFQ